ncbi:hypothetical protein BIV57_11420 [Mangrovactinospora gilvigrisea]|uniref:Uncharacterized protein n=1 Tax=Mangrovactinospora gilvigrisea TaxID=1428644 RepID=A0A1J7CCF0_9ACTN|nr:hypothetical protein [Mangrovactinospora gilvigrisea]OIV37346.1 hypothetical protein BIV57_11420 [Mangrovactinospora gilvigrisea]
MSGDSRNRDELRTELEAALAARRDLGPEYEHALVESFLDRMDHQLRDDRRSRLASEREAAAATRDRARESMGLALGSLGIGVPLSGIATSSSGLWGLVVTWLGILGINAIHAWFRRARRQHG